MRPWNSLPWWSRERTRSDFAVNAIVKNAWPDGTKPDPFGQQRQDLSGWVVELTDPDEVGATRTGSVAAVLVMTLLKGWHRKVTLTPLIYLGLLRLGKKLVVNPSVTRLIFLGALLVALMNIRPQGLRHAGGDHVMALLELRDVSLSFGGLKSSRS